MSGSIVSALAALAGAITGGLTSVVASWLTQHAQARAQWLAQDKLQRQELYREFVDTASKCYIHALQCDKAVVELFRQGEQNAHPVLAGGGRKCRVGRAKDRRYVSGA